MKKPEKLDQSAPFDMLVCPKFMGSKLGQEPASKIFMHICVAV